MGEDQVLVNYYTLDAPFEIEQRVVRQIEYYFSNENLPGDDFLFNKTMKRDSTAWVPISVLQTFRKIKMLGCSQVFIAMALGRYSLDLEVSRDNVNVRRLEPLPPNLADPEDIYERSLKIEGVPANMTIQMLEEKFSRYGALRTVRVMNATRSKDAVNPYAVIEYDSKRAAELALKRFIAESNSANTSRGRKIIPGEECSVFKAMKLPRTPTKDRSNFHWNKRNKTNSLTPTKKKLIPEFTESSMAHDVNPEIQHGKVEKINHAGKCGFITAQYNLEERLFYFDFEYDPSKGTNSKLNELQLGDFVQFKIRNDEVGEIEAFDVKKWERPVIAKTFSPVLGPTPAEAFLKAKSSFPKNKATSAVTNAWKKDLSSLKVDANTVASVEKCALKAVEKRPKKVYSKEELKKFAPPRKPIDQLASSSVSSDKENSAFVNNRRTVSNRTARA